LAEALENTAVFSIFNGDAGDGSWQKEVQSQPWVGADARVIGYDLDEPMQYNRSMQVDPNVHWRGLTVLTDRYDPGFPKPRSVDMTHVAFMEMSTPTSWRLRLFRYLSLVREGGWALLSHSHAYDALYVQRNGFKEKVRDRLVEDTLAARGWKLQAVFDHDSAPSDYPKSYWWEQFAQSKGRRSQALQSQGFDLTNFLLVFRKEKKK
jgi:hypothetical protein